MTANMVYTMIFYVDGGCRGNGNINAIGAAAVVEKLKSGHTRTFTWALEPNRYRPVTSQRAEISAIIYALEEALEKWNELDTCPRLDVTIYTDSKYAANCMNDWIYKWSGNGWINSAGNEVANKDLIQKASNLDDRLKELGSVTYQWIPRSQNTVADDACNSRLDEM